MLFIELGIEEASYLKDLLHKVDIPAGKAGLHFSLEKKIESPYIMEKFVNGIKSGTVGLSTGNGIPDPTIPNQPAPPEPAPIIASPLP